MPAASAAGISYSQAQRAALQSLPAADWSQPGAGFNVSQAFDGLWQMQAPAQLPLRSYAEVRLLRRGERHANYTITH